LIIGFASLLLLASQNPQLKNQTKMENNNKNQLPTIGILVFNGFLANEVVAPLDVFTKAKKDEKPLFKVLLVAETTNILISEEGLKVIPDVTIEDCPDLDVLVVPSSMTPTNKPITKH